MATREELRRRRETDFRDYIQRHPDEAQAVLAASLVREVPYTGLADVATYMNVVDRHRGYLLAVGAPHERIGSRADVQRITLSMLEKLEKDSQYFVRGGDFDFLMEEGGKWEQIGGANVQAKYREALQRGVNISVIAGQDPFRKERNKGKQVVEILKGMRVMPRLVDYPLRAVVSVRKFEDKPPLKEAVVWYSAAQTSTPFESHDPETSFYDGFHISSENQQSVPFIGAVEKALKDLEKDAVDAENFIKDLEEREEESRRRSNGNGAGSGK